MTLKCQLDAFQDGWKDRAGPETVALVAAANERLAASGLLGRIRKQGDLFPAATLPDASGREVDLALRLRQGPLIISFYRGGWCPYCNLELRAYQVLLDDIRAAGGDLVAISPERPDDALSTAEKNDLSFMVLSDVDGRLAAALGIRFDLDDPIIGLYRKFGHDLPARNGDGRWSLPVPATFVVDREGTILLAHADPDYRNRLEPADALAALRASVARDAA